MIIQNNVYLCYALIMLSVMEKSSKNIASSVSLPFGYLCLITMIKATGDAPLLKVMKEEIFVAITGYERSYAISNYGRVKSLPKAWVVNETLTATRKERIRKLSIDKDGYYKVNLWNKCKNKRFLVSRLVALHFIPNPLNLPQVNHKDGKKLNNYEENLEWITGQGNIQHAFDNGLINVSKGEDHCHAILKNDDIQKIYELLNKGLTQKQVSKIIGITSIEKIVLEESWKHIGIDFSKFRRKTPSSNYKCVYYCPRNDSKQWAARTRIKGKDYFLGYFNEEIEAHNTYQNFINKL